MDEFKKQKDAEAAHHSLYLHVLMRLANSASELIAMEEIYESISQHYPVFSADDLRPILRATFKQILPKEFWDDPKHVKEHMDLCVDSFTAAISFFDLLIPTLHDIVKTHPDLCSDIINKLQNSLVKEPVKDSCDGLDNNVIIPDVGECFPGPEPSEFN